LKKKEKKDQPQLKHIIKELTWQLDRGNGVAVVVES
jgi:hypothetical protein